MFPNLLKIGRNNSRAMQGPARIPKNPGELMKKIESLYSAFYKVWNTSHVPKLLKAPKWYKESEEDLKVDDIVYFRKVENELSSKWTVGKIVKATKGRDGHVRRVDIEYKNHNEDVPRVTDRAARSVIKLFHINDSDWQDDMAKVEKLLELLEATDRYTR